MHRIIVVGGGSFQGKSLIALHIAYKFKIPTIICTDTIRNALSTLNPKKSYFSTSTYLMSPEDLTRQIHEVSKVLKEMISIYEKRGESIIIEGMHLSPALLDYLATKNNVFSLCLDNQLSLEKRLKYKSITRDRAEYYDQKAGIIKYTSFRSNSLYSIKYKKYAKRIAQIHSEIVNKFLRKEFPVITFNNINVAMKKVDILIENWSKNCVSKNGNLNKYTSINYLKNI